MKRIKSIRVVAFLLKRRVFVKPVRAYENEADSQGWLVRQSNTVSEFIDDAQRYGLGMAIRNARELWRIDQCKSTD